MSYNSDDYFFSNDFKALLAKFKENEDNGAYAMLDSEELIDIAEYFYNNGDRPKAVEIIDKTAAMYPGSTAPWLFKARIALLDDDDIEKAKEYSEMIEDKSDPEYYYIKAEIMLVEGLVVEADAYLEGKYWETDDDDKDFFAIDTAALFIDYDESGIAEEWLSRSEATDALEYKEQKARILVDKGEYEKSKELLNELIDANPYSTLYWNALAASQFFNDNIEESIQSSEYSIAIDPNNTAALLNKANGLYNLGNFKDALTYYQRYIKLCPDDENCEMLIGFCQMVFDEFDTSIEHYKRAEELAAPKSPVLVDIYKNWAFALCRLNRMDECMAILDRTKDLDCDQCEILVYRANLYIGVGEIRKAKKLLMQALKKSNYSPTIFMKIAITVFECGDPHLAYKMFNALYDSYNDWQDGHAYYAACCYDLNKTDEFLEHLKKADTSDTPMEWKYLFSKLFPDNMQPKDYYGCMKKKLGK